MTVETEIIADTATEKPESLSVGSLYFSRFISLAGALGSGLQFVLGMVDFLKNLGQSSVALIYGISGAFGGFFGGLINLFINVELLEDFLKRIKDKRLSGITIVKEMNLKNVGKLLLYWSGILVFVGTGVLFGMTALAFGGSGGVLGILGITAGILVAVIMIVQECETWAKCFKDLRSDQEIIEHANALKPSKKAKGLALALSLINVFGLSAGFAFGLITVLHVYFGVALIPAVTIGLAISFSTGAFTEYVFYNYFLADFITNFKERWSDFFKNKSTATVGLLSIGINAGINGILSVTAMLGLNALLLSAGFAAIPLGVTIATGVFCGVVSLVLGADFWIRLMKKIFGEPAHADLSATVSHQSMVKAAALVVSSYKVDQAIAVEPPVIVGSAEPCSVQKSKSTAKSWCRFLSPRAQGYERILSAEEPAPATSLGFSNNY